MALHTHKKKIALLTLTELLQKFERGIKCNNLIEFGRKCFLAKLVGVKI